MQSCQKHWDALRKALEDRGLDKLVPQGGEEAASRQLDQLQSARVTRDNFDPLMGAFWAIAGNCSERISRAGGNPLYLLADGPEDPVDVGVYPTAAGRTWPKCPLCYVSMVHELTCDGGACKLPKVDGYDWMIERAAEEQLEKARALKLAPGVQ